MTRAASGWTAAHELAALKVAKSRLRSASSGHRDARRPPAISVTTPRTGRDGHSQRGGAVAADVPARRASDGKQTTRSKTSPARLRPAAFRARTPSTPPMGGKERDERSLSSNAKCNTPRRFDIGKVVQGSVGRKPPSPGSCSGTHSLWAGTRRFTPPEPINCAGGVKRSSNERPLYVCSSVTGSPRDGRPNRSPVG